MSDMTEINELTKQLESCCRKCSDKNERIQELEKQLAKAKMCIENTMAVENDLHKQLAESVPKSEIEKVLESRCFYIETAVKVLAVKHLEKLLT